MSMREELKAKVSNAIDPATTPKNEVIPVETILAATRGTADLQESPSYQIQGSVPVEDEMSTDLFQLYQDENSPSTFPLFTYETKSYNNFSDKIADRFSMLAKLSEERYDEVLSSNKEISDVFRLNSKRAEEAGKQADASLASLYDMAAQGADDELLRKANASFQDRLDKTKDFAMELRAARNLVDFAKRNPDWAQFSLDNTDLFETHLEEIQKDLIIKSYVDAKIQENVEPHWWESISESWDDGKELLASVFLDEAFVVLTNNFGKRKSTRLKQEADRIRKLSPEEIPQALDEYWAELLDYSSVYVEDNEVAAADLQASFGTNLERSINNGMMGVDAAITLLTAGVGTSLKTLKKSGNVDVVAKDAAKVITNQGESTLYENSAEALADALPVKPGEGSSVYTHHAVKEEIDNISAVLEDAAVLPSPERLSPAEATKAVDRTINNLRVKNDVANLGISYDEVMGVYTANVEIGKVSGGGYQSKKAAEVAMKKIGINGEVVSTDTGFKIKASLPVQESFADSGLNIFKTRHPLVSFFQGPKAYVDSTIGQLGTSAAFKEARISGIAKDIYNKNIDKLSAKDRNNLSDIWEEGYDREEWFSPEELSDIYRTKTGGDIPEAVERAYYATAKLSDFAWFVQNRAVYQDKVAKGFNSIRIDGVVDEPFNGKILSKDSQITREKLIYDSERREAVQATRETLDELSSRGLTIVEPEDASWTNGVLGSPASYIAVNGKALKVSQLDFNQLGYRAGGRRVYESPFFIGQQNHVKTVNGVRYLGAPRVFRTADNISDAKRYIDEMNAMFKDIEEYNVVIKEAENISDATLRADTLARLKMEMQEHFLNTYKRSFDDFVRDITEEGWDTSVTVQMKRDREDFEPLDYAGRAAVKLYDPQSISPSFGVPKRNRLSSRGAHLKSITGEDSMTLDFQSALRESMDQAIKFGAYSDFKISAVNKFATTFGPYVDGFERMSPYDMVVRGQPLESLAKSVDPEHRKIYRAFKAHQFYIKAILRMRTKWDESVETFMNSLAQAIEGGGEWVGRRANQKAGKQIKKISTSLYKAGNPIEKIRSLNYDLNLGMFNPAQFVLQAQSAVTATAMSPKYGMQAFMEMVPLRYAVIMQDDAATATINKMVRDNVKELDSLADIEKSAAQFKRIGFNNFGSNLAMIDAQTSMGSYTNPYMNKVARAREAGRLFFQEGERIGRLTAYGIAKRKYAERFGGDVYSKKADNWIREEADRLLLSPNSDNNQMFTKGALSLPTQFWSYMGKMADVMLTGANGRYTPKERGLLVGSQLVFYGSAGMPLVDWLSENSVDEYGQSLSSEQIKFVHNGLIDGLIYLASDGEINTDLSSSAGFGGFVRSMVQNFSERPIGNILGGATGGNISRAVDAVVSTAELNGAFLSPDPESISEAGLAGVFSLVKSMDRANQAYMAYNTGIWYDKYYRPVFKMNKQEALAYFVGLNPQDRSSVYDILSDRREARDKFVNETSKILQGLHEKYHLAKTPEEKENIKQIIRAYSSISKQSGYWGDVTSRFFSFQRDETYLDSLVKRAAQDEIKGRDTNNMMLSIEQRQKLSEENN